MSKELCEGNKQVQETKEEFQWSKVDYLLFPPFMIIFIVLWLSLQVYEPTIRRTN